MLPVLCKVSELQLHEISSQPHNLQQSTFSATVTALHFAKGKGVQARRLLRSPKEPMLNARGFCALPRQPATQPRSSQRAATATLEPPSCIRAQARGAPGGRGMRSHPPLPVSPPALDASMPAQPGRAHCSSARPQPRAPPATPQHMSSAAALRPRPAPGRRRPRSAAGACALPPRAQRLCRKGVCLLCLRRICGKTLQLTARQASGCTRAAATVMPALRRTAQRQKWHC